MFLGVEEEAAYHALNVNFSVIWCPFSILSAGWVSWMIMLAAEMNIFALLIFAHQSTTVLVAKVQGLGFYNLLQEGLLKIKENDIFLGKMQAFF